MPDEFSTVALPDSSPALPPPLPAVPVRPVWTSLVAGVVAIVAALVVSGMVGFVAVMLAGKVNPTGGAQFEAGYSASLSKMLTTWWGVAAIAMPGQLAMLGTALGAAMLSSEKLKQRIGYVRGTARWWMVPLLILGTMFTGVTAGLLTEFLFPVRSASLQAFETMGRDTSTGTFIATLIMLSVVPAFVEESLFRGYIQRRLLQRWSPLPAIVTSTAFFTLAHFDLQHMLAVIPLGLWLGYLAWRTGSLWPGMLCHAAENVFALIGLRYADPSTPGSSPSVIPALVVMGSAFTIVIWQLQRTKPHPIVA